MRATPCTLRLDACGRQTYQQRILPAFSYNSARRDLKTENDTETGSHCIDALHCILRRGSEPLLAHYPSRSRVSYNFESYTVESLTTANWRSFVHVHESCKCLQIAYSVQAGNKAGHGVAFRLKPSCAVTARAIFDADSFDKQYATHRQGQSRL